MTTTFSWAKDTDTVPLPIITQAAPPAPASDTATLPQRIRARAQARSIARTNDETATGQTIRRASALTRRRARTTTIAYLALAAVLWAAWRLNHPIVHGAGARLAWQLPLAATTLITLPALIRVRLPAAWALPLLVAAPTGYFAWRTWRAVPPVPETCGPLGDLAGTCAPTTWPTWAATIILTTLTIKCLLLAWSAWEDSITPIRVDYRGMS